MLKDSNPFTKRLLFRKIIKGFEEQESVLADHGHRIQSLEVQLEKARPRMLVDADCVGPYRQGG